MNRYTFKEYQDLVENTKIPWMRNAWQSEMDVIVSLASNKKTLVDIGAGYGRILPYVARLFPKIICIEQNREMLPELRRRAREHENVEVVEKDALSLKDILKGREKGEYLFTVLQNTLSNIEGSGNRMENTKALLSEMKGVRLGTMELVTTFLTKEGFSYAYEFYEGMEEWIGPIDYERTEQGLLVTKKGYVSKWMSASEIEQIKKYLGGVTLQEIVGTQYRILHQKFS